MNATCEEIFTDFFIDYCRVKEKPELKFVVTSRDRDGDRKSNPHAFPGNAIDIILKNGTRYAPTTEYNDLFRYMVEIWPFRAGIDNTEYETKKGKHPNVHIHIDLGQNRPAEQELPFFFIEDNEAFQKQVREASEV